MTLAERKAAWERLRQAGHRLPPPTGLPVFVGIDPGAAEGDETDIRTSLPPGAWLELAREQLQPDPRDAEIAKLRAELAGFRIREEQTIREIANLHVRLAAFTAQNVRPLEEKPEAPAIFRAIAPSRSDPRRLGLA